MVFRSMDKLKEMRKNLIFQTKRQVSEKLSGDDVHLVRAVSSFKNLEQIFNLVSEQVFEWYGLHFPEFRGNVSDPVLVLKVIVSVGDRKNFSVDSLSNIVSDSSLVEKIVNWAENSSGGKIENHSLKSVQLLAQEALNIKTACDSLQSFVKKQMVEIAPNFSELATSLIASQLLARAGSLERLASMPGSTIQVLGAEEALFSHLRNKTKSPKHGFIFNHPLIKSLPKKARGKMARTLSGKLAICVREDFFGKKRIVDEYKPKLEKLHLLLKKNSFGK